LADAIGAEIGDARLQCYAAFTHGWIHGMRGDYAAGLAACERSLKRSPGPVNTAIARGFLGYIHLGQGDIEGAISALTEAIEQSAQFRQRHSQVLFTAYLGDAWVAAGRPERAREVATEALPIARDAQFRWGIGALQAVLGKSALAQGALAEAEACLDEALATFESVPAMYMMACVRLVLAELAHARADPTTVRGHLQTARDLFKQGAVPTLVRRTEEVAKRLGTPLLAEEIVEGTTENPS
jgi:tetratricopeptide (TPR) repeat protein